MSSISKRHQARNERALQELIKTVPGNDRCADCDARNPGWASWNLGIFLCMRCAALHRKLGTHISKVKSLSMDTWSSEQVEQMRKMGNTASNASYNPRSAKPQVPLDVDEIDGAMERFIRQKYDQRSLTRTATTAVPQRSTSGLEHRAVQDLEDSPPQPPPKTSRRLFGLRSVSSALPLSRKDKGNYDIGPPVPRKNSRGPAAGIHVHKQPRVLGATLALSQEGTEWKLTTLKEMGFPDDQRNSQILKGMNGDLERTIESLVRLGEGSGARGHTVTTANTHQRPAVSSAAASNEQQPEPSDSFPDVPQLAQPQPQSQPSTSSVSMQRPASSQQRSNNPFENMNPLSAPLENSFQNMYMSNPLNPLFPNNTGGAPNYGQQLHDARMNHTMTPPVPQMPQQYAQSNPFLQNQSGNFSPFIGNAPFSAPLQPSNPFLSQQQPQSLAAQNSYQSPDTTSQFAPQSPNPFQQSQQQQQYPTSSNPFLAQQPQQPIRNFQGSIHQSQHTQVPPQSAQLAPPQPLFAMQSFPANPYSAPYSQQNFANSYQQPQPLVPQRTGLNKSDILALYNQPQVASSQPNQPDSLQPGTPSTPKTAPLPQANRSPQRSVTMPLLPSVGSKNPFFTGPGSSMQAAIQTHGGGVRQISQDSSQSGRHSPDAFASLSARFAR